MKIALLNYLQAKLNSIVIALFCLAVSSLNIGGVSDLASCVPPIQSLKLYVDGCIKLSDTLHILATPADDKLSQLLKALVKEIKNEIDSDLEVI